MNEQLIADIGVAATAISVALSEFRTEIENATDGNDNRLLLDATIPGGADYSVTDIFAGISALLGYLKDLKMDNGTFVPKALLAPVLAKLNDVNAQIASARSIFANIASNGGIKLIDPENFSITATNDSVHQFSKALRSLFNGVDGAFAAWYQARFVIKAPRLTEFKKFMVEMEKQRSSVKAIIGDANSLATDIKLKNEKMQSFLNESVAAKDEIVRVLHEGQTERRTMSEYAAEATAKLAEIRATDEKSAEFHTAIDGYKSKFDLLDASIEQRGQDIDKETEKLRGIHADLDGQRKELSRLLKESEGLLKGATNVGLASSFSNLQSKIGKELGWARFSFYVSIGFLIVLSLPIALYVFPGLQALVSTLGIDVTVVLPKGAIGEHSTPDTLAQIAARALLLVPGIWLVRFAGARHERLFRLREQYAYKYSIASSVEGFKRQAPDLEQGIAATAFYELTFNPATRMDANSSEARYPNPAMEWFMKKLGGQSGGTK